MPAKGTSSTATVVRMTPQQQALNFVLTGISCSCAQTVVHPIETTMVRQQLTPKGQKTPSARAIFRSEGLKGLYRGISAGIVRESTYSTLRFGMYEPIRDALSDNPAANRALLGPNGESAVRVTKRVLAGCTAGGIAAALFSPTDLVKIRMQRDTKLPVPGVWEYVRAVAARPGGPIAPFYEGVSTTIARATVLGATKMAVYNEIKDALKRRPDHADESLRARQWQRFVPGSHSWRDTDWKRFGWDKAPSAAEHMSLVFLTATSAGLAITITTSPFTNARTHIMANPGKYTGLFSALVGIVRTYGPQGLFRGFGAQWARFGPYALVQFIAWEQLRYLCGLPTL